MEEVNCLHKNPSAAVASAQEKPHKFSVDVFTLNFIDQRPYISDMQLQHPGLIENRWIRLR